MSFMFPLKVAAIVEVFYVLTASIDRQEGLLGSRL